MTTKKVLLLIAAGLFSSSLYAQELSGEFIGDIYSANGTIGNSSATSVKVNFTYDTSIPLTGSPTTGFTYGGNLIRVTYEFFDAQGNPVNFGLPTPYELPPLAQPDNLHGSFETDNETYSFNTLSYTLNGEYFRAYFNIQANVRSSIFSQLTAFPLFQEILNEPDAYESTLIINNGAGFTESWVYVGVHTLRYIDLIQDADGDGVADTLDACADSLLDPNVMFGPIDSGVSNYVDVTGCSIMDHYAACEAEEAEEPTSPWGWIQPVYSGPTYCEKQVSYNLVADGVIDHTESRMLRRALYQSHQ
ncbi:hypothetical protein [Pseudidiomarina insulisalsae]|uniref:Uncharacterized protein n=1 Tax=Pseudidiomarina insulisalsae TaxID=575789 RepID=A0A432YQL8_9GAMM|nr:hypothetical protein [Pseudidiomarina insulisalsae]RUO63665.1 hypothetical protein CWI71_00955 [Pseudidiomarina insulisalsae]